MQANANPTVLVATDFEASSTKALAVAHEMAERLDAELVLVHVCPVPTLPAYGAWDLAVPPPPSIDTMMTAARTSLDNQAKSAGIQRTLLRKGDATEELLAVIDDLRPEMVVVGTHGRTGLARLALGSVAENVVRRSVAPVLTVRTSS